MEVNIKISNELREVLNTIKDSSLVAQVLLQDVHTSTYLVDSPINFLSIAKDDKTKISYLTEDRIKSTDPMDYWSSSRRYQAKPGSIVSKLFKGIPSSEIEKFSNLFISQSNKLDFRFDIVRGEDIKHYYYYENYSSSNGSLGSSCMKHSHCQDYFQLYTENDDNVSMLVMFRPGDSRCIGRALLWDFDSNKIMDRIYTINDELLSFYFKQWATENGYFYKSEQNWYNTLYFEQIGQSKKEFRLNLKLKKSLQYKYPYMDTFKFICMDSGTLYNYLPENTNSLKTLCGSEGGTQSSDYLIFDEISNVMRYRHDSAYINYLTPNIYTGRDNAYYSSYNDRWMLREHCTYNELIGDYIFIDDYEPLNNPEIAIAIKRREEEKKEYKIKLENKTKLNSESLIRQLSDTSNFYNSFDWSNSGFSSLRGSTRGRLTVTSNSNTEGIEPTVEDTQVVNSEGITRSDFISYWDSIKDDTINDIIQSIDLPF